jgi:hypothetical protein
MLDEKNFPWKNVLAYFSSDVCNEENKVFFTLTPDYTVIFVAFDTEEPGSFGSLQVRTFQSYRLFGDAAFDLKTL